ncbi:sporulation protein [Motilibacter aurantiacus]|uniref:sporulation protein n=1 Tax=Motilibacter aurantiacus TaxID=2714955 RepID=UPI0014094B42|nr:sporulation protein [Motilibacter aurantiacus]NHC45014.1 sporulation protein [Motilibacter aurantiacus]
MAFRKFLARLGAGSASVETTLEFATGTPGGALPGRVEVVGGEVEQQVERVVVALEALVEVESGDSEWKETIAFGETQVSGGMTVAPGQRLTLSFSLPVPWEAPLTSIGGWRLHGMKVGVRTRLSIAGAVDPGDTDPIDVVPTPAQATVLEALASLGFRFKSADVEKGRIPGSTMPFYQELEFAPAPQYAGRINELEVTFLTSATGLDVVLEADRRGGLISSGSDSVSRVRLGHGDLDTRSVAQVLDGAVQQLGARRGWF